MLARDDELRIGKREASAPQVSVRAAAQVRMMLPDPGERNGVTRLPRFHELFRLFLVLLEIWAGW